MKKLFAFLLSLCLLLPCGLPAAAFGAEDYDVVYGQTCLYIDVDTTAQDPAALSQEILALEEAVKDVTVSDTPLKYDVAAPAPHTAYLAVELLPPYRISILAVRSLLRETPGVLSLDRPAYARSRTKENVWYSMKNILVTVSAEETTKEAALAALSSYPGVHSAVWLSEPDGAHAAEAKLELAYPQEKVFFSLLRELPRALPFVAALQPEEIAPGTLPANMPAEPPDAPQRIVDSPYEVIYCWNRLFVGVDRRSGKTERVLQLIRDSGAALGVRPAPEPRQISAEEVFPIYCSKDFDCYLVDIAPPYEENSRQLKELLRLFAPEVRADQAVIGCLGSPWYGTEAFGMRLILVEADLSLTDAETALAQLAALDHVTGVRLENEGEEAPLFAEILVGIEAPFPENFAAVTQAVGRLPYVFDVQYEMIMGFGAGIYQTYIGDVDGDGKVTAADARRILRYSVGLEAPMLYYDQLKADLDFDGGITATDARLALRASVGLEKLNRFEAARPKYASLLVSGSVSLTKRGSELLLTAAVTGANNVTKCGFRYVRLQRLINGVWTDVPGASYTDLSSDSNSKVFSVVLKPAAGTYRAVCAPYVQAPYLGFMTRESETLRQSPAVVL